MNIQTVADNLRNTIKGKEAYLVEMQTKAIKAEDNANMAAAFATIEFLKININELKVILFDVEQCQILVDNPAKMSYNQHIH